MLCSSCVYGAASLSVRLFMPMGFPEYLDPVVNIDHVPVYFDEWIICSYDDIEVAIACLPHGSCVTVCVEEWRCDPFGWFLAHARSMVIPWHTLVSVPLTSASGIVEIIVDPL